MTFEEDLAKRRIDVTAFAAGDPEKFAAWQSLYQQVHPNTFYTSVKMIINDVRRRFWLPEAPRQATVAATPAAAKPVMRRATGTVPSTASAIPDEPSPSVDRTPEPAPAPRGRAVIRRPAPVANSETPVEKDFTAEPTQNPANESTSPEVPKSGRARPVFRRPTAEAEAGDLPESKDAKENNASITPDPTNTPAESPKPARPRPVFRKPSTPATSAIEEEVTQNVPTEAAAFQIPDHSNPDPEATEVPKPPRPRPVFKRPTTTTSEPEKTAIIPENAAATISQPESAAEKPKEGEVAADGIKPPRPRPIFKRTATASDAPEPEKKPEEIHPENAAEPAPIADKPTFPRPRPVIKRPVANTESKALETPVVNLSEIENAAPISTELENKSQEQPLNVTLPATDVTPDSGEIKAEPVASKTPRPRPIFKKPAKSEPNAEVPENKPDAE
jgi:hypothetical protein